MFDLTGKGALVTGASGGIGAAVAKALHAQGANVAISGTRKEKLDALAKELGDRVHVLPCDLRDRAAVVKLAEEAEKTVGQVDILVNNAGITHDNLFMRMKDEEWDDVINVNLNSVFVLTRGILRGMMRRRYGRIVNIASISGVFGNPGQANYVAGNAFMEALAWHRRARGLPATAISWGAISDTGYLARNARVLKILERRIALRPMTAAQGFVKNQTPGGAVGAVEHPVGRHGNGHRSLPVFFVWCSIVSVR